MSKHTPGPWTVIQLGSRGGFLVMQSAAREVAALDADDDSASVEVARADARLIATAPCLLAAAELALANLMRNLASEEACGQPFMGDDEHEAIAVLSAAIAKARGDA